MILDMATDSSLLDRFEALEKRLLEVEGSCSELREENARKDEENRLLRKENAELREKAANLQAQVAWFQRQMFGSRSEKRDPYSDVPSLFAEQASVPETKPQNDDVEDNETSQERRRRKREVRVMTENLPVLETEVIEPEDIDLERYRRIGEEVTRIVKHQPGKLYVKEIIRPKYGLKSSVEPVETGKGVLIAPMPLLPIPKGLPDASLLTEMLLDKYEYHVPFYRQIKKFYHMGLRGLKEPTVVGWFKRTMELMKPLYDALENEVFRCGYIQTDESVVRVMNKEKHEASQEYIWMTRAVIERLVLFYYDLGDRDKDVISDKWSKHKFKGYNQCDGYASYTAACKANPGVVLVFCMAHFRRYVEHAESENKEAARYLLSRIQQLYRLEQTYINENLSYDERRERRQKEAKPIMDEIGEWMETEGIKYSPSSLLGQAVTYGYTRMEGLKRYLEDGRLEIDNNKAENEIRPVTVCRKNFLFCGNHEAAGNMCVIMSLLATCRNHNVNPRAYLNDIISRMPYMAKATHEELVELLPHKWKLTHEEHVMEDFRQLQKS